MSYSNKNYQNKKKKQCEKVYTRMIGVLGPTGPTGPTGPQGERGPIGPQGAIGPQGIVGATGPQGEMGPQGVVGATGPQGERGADGTSVTIMGNYDTPEELQNEHPRGDIGSAYLVGDNLFVWSEEEEQWTNVGVIRGPKGEQGVSGPTGPTGPTGPQGQPGYLDIPMAFFLTTSKDLTDGTYIVDYDENFPIATMSLDTSSNYYIDSRNNTITIFETGIYRIDFMVMAHPTAPVSPQAGSDVISVAFKKVGLDDICFGTSVWTNGGKSVLITGTGYINQTVPRGWYELSNVGKYAVIVESPPTDSLIIDSPLVTPAVSIMIQKVR